MRILLHVGHPSLQRSLVSALLARQCDVRLLGPHAAAAAAEWAAGVEPWPSPTSTAESAAVAAAGCDALVVVDGSLTGSTQQQATSMTENEFAALLGSGVPRLVTAHPSWRTRPADHRSVASPNLPRRISVESDLVYGVTDDPITLFVIMMRSLPAIPILSDTYRLHPLWHEDFAAAIAELATVEHASLRGTVRLAGVEGVTSSELFDLVAACVDRRPLRVPMPDFLASHGSRLAEALRLDAPLPPSLLQFAESSPEAAGADDLLPRLLGRQPTPASDAIRKLLRQLSEVTPDEGVGTLEVKRFSANMRATAWDAHDLLRHVRGHFAEVMPVPVGVEPAAPSTSVNAGDVLTIALPGRGHVEVRVEEVDDTQLVLATLRGHVVAGIVRFAVTPLQPGVGFEVMTCDRAANAFDWVTLTLAGARIQDANWIKVVKNVAKLAGDADAEVTTDSRRLDDHEAASVQRWIEAIIARQRQASHGRASGGSTRGEP